MLNPLEYQFKNTLRNYGYDVTVNGTNQVRILLKEYEEGTSTIDYKYLLARNGLIKQGDIVEIFNDNWIVMHEDVTINNVYTRVIIRRLKFNINFNFEGDIKSIPSAVDEGTYRVDEGNLIALPDGRIILQLQENEESKQIGINQRFIIMGNAWKVIQKTNSEHGIYKIYCDIDTFNIEDDKENEIADRWKYATPDSYTITINNIVEGALPLDSTLQLDVTATKNDEVVILPLVYTSSNTDILTVDDTGLITCIGIGIANITVAVADDLTVTDTIALTVEEVELGEYEITISGYDTIMFGTWEYQTATVTLNGIEVDDAIVFEIIGDESWFWITDVEHRRCKVNASKDRTKRIVILRVSLASNPDVYAEKELESVAW